MTAVDAERLTIAVDATHRVSGLLSLPPGCAYGPRCPSALPRCRETAPPELIRDGRTVRCWLAAEDAGRADLREGAA